MNDQFIVTLKHVAHKLIVNLTDTFYIRCFSK